MRLEDFKDLLRYGEILHVSGFSSVNDFVITRVIDYEDGFVYVLEMVNGNATRIKRVGRSLTEPAEPGV